MEKRRMKVLILNGSPKNEQRNTLKLTNSFLDGMKEYGAIEEEYIHVSQKDMKPCLGCFCCWTKTPGQFFLHYWEYLHGGFKNGIDFLSDFQRALDSCHERQGVSDNIDREL